MAFPSFSVGEVLTAADMNAVGLWRVTSCTVTSVGGTAATASNGVITIGTNNTSLTVSNAFSADYQSYRIFVETHDTNGGSSHRLQLSGLTTTNYFTGGSFGSWGLAAQTGYGPAGTTSWIISANNTAGTGASMVIDLTNPNIARRKYGTSLAQAGNGHATFNLYFNTTTTATGFVFTKDGDTFSGGTIRVYGYRN